MTTTPTDPMIGRLLDGRYQIRSRIARGGMATVYLATDLRLERRVAIKVMHGHLADDSKFKERFIQEARSAARLAHPNVVNVFDQGQDSDMAYLVMEYLPGITLRELLQEHRVLTTEQTLDIMEAVLSGLAAAHKAGIVHRDLKPENVLLADDGRIKISDFGLARAASAATATGAALLGTIAYLSPELVTRGAADTRSDIYALGIMMYEMLVGEQPFKGDQPMRIAYQHANDTVPAPSSKNPKVPRELDEIVQWATERDPEQRPKDARAMLDQLYEVHSSLMTAEPPTGVTAVQRTMVLPAAIDPAPLADTGSTAETQVLGSRGAVAAAVASAPPAGTPATRRRRRGLIAVIVAIVTVIAVAAGIGYYYGFGPGSRTTIPDVANQSPEQARQTLTDLGLVVQQDNGQTSSPVVPVDLVAQVAYDGKPSMGASVPNGATVQLLVSTGPAMLQLPEILGLPQAQATANITQAGFAVADPVIQQFSADVAEGTVIDALGTDGASLDPAGTYPEQAAITLVVSAGALPDVTGRSPGDAFTALKDVGLVEGASGDGGYSDTVPAGAVLGVRNANGGDVYRVGDTVDVLVSQGPEPVTIPDVIGLTWAEAKPLLEGAGLSLSYNPGADFAPGLSRVSGLEPGAGESVPKGTQVKISFTI